MATETIRKRVTRYLGRKNKDEETDEVIGRLETATAVIEYTRGVQNIKNILDAVPESVTNEDLERFRMILNLSEAAGKSKSARVQEEYTALVSDMRQELNSMPIQKPPGEMSRELKNAYKLRSKIELGRETPRKMRKIQKTYEAFKDCAEADKDHPSREVCFELGRIAEKLELHNEAKGYFEKSLKIGTPEYNPAVIGILYASAKTDAAIDRRTFHELVDYKNK